MIKASESAGFIFTMIKEIVQQPWSTWQLVTALLKREIVAVDQFQPLCIRINKLTCSAEQRAEFKLMFNCQQLPPSFLFNIGYRHLGQLLAQAKFPSKLMGLIHLSSHYNCLDTVDWRQEFDIELAIKHCQKTDKGLMYLVDITLIQAGKNCLVCSNHILDKDRNYRGKPLSQTEHLQREALSSAKLTGKVARDYAKLSGDFNPIHISALSAKIFGMKKAVMHGMYNLHWSLSQLPEINQAKHISAQFNRPCYLPKTVDLIGLGAGKYGVFSNKQQDRHLYLELN